MINRATWGKYNWLIRAVILLYIVIGLLTLSTSLLGFLGYKFPLGIYGISTNSQNSLLGAFLLMIFALKGYVGYSYLVGEKYALSFGIFDSIIGIVLCIYSGFILPFYSDSNNVALTFRLEILILVPFLSYSIKLIKTWPTND